MAERAVLRAKKLDEHGRHLLLAGDPVAPGEVLAAPSAPMVDIAICLLDVDEVSQRERLLGTDQNRGESGCAAVGYRRHRGSGTGLQPERLTDGTPPPLKRAATGPRMARMNT